MIAKLPPIFLRENYDLPIIITGIGIKTIFTPQLNRKPA